MKITKNGRTVFLLPTRLIVNDLTAGIICIKLKKEGISLTRKQISLFIKEVRRYKKNHSDWHIIEAGGKNGDAVRIKI